MCLQCTYCRGSATPALSHLLGEYALVCKACFDALMRRRQSLHSKKASPNGGGCLLELPLDRARKKSVV